MRSQYRALQYSASRGKNRWIFSEDLDKRVRYSLFSIRMHYRSVIFSPLRSLVVSNIVRRDNEPCRLSVIWVALSWMKAVPALLLSVAYSLENAINCLHSSMKRPGQSSNMLDRGERTILLPDWNPLQWRVASWRQMTTTFIHSLLERREIAVMGILQLPWRTTFDATNNRNWLNICKISNITVNALSTLLGDVLILTLKHTAWKHSVADLVRSYRSGIVWIFSF